ncbi:hypothetical protein FISHEDRAFT_72393 [Fistulina hepatica ATCC 64428]|uniref:Pierisin-like domain-containing protein n=1 Tax=Fistulina hepatica ATCC 64428 TaxID=1128425 RepID=A0A0D7AEE9_9AGAR|nr:hypothetical protein FISHEDRAFT_72393 [Fistulina hepatica ATCC 64428]
MSSGNWFATSTISWFGSQADEVINNIARKIDPAPPTPSHIFRPDTVPSAMQEQVVPTVAEPLIRWDRRNPSYIFQHALSLGTARYYRDDANRLRRLHLPNMCDHVTYQYEIFAYGGINVNRLLRPHEYNFEHEIAFPGGIQREFIRSVRVYRDETLQTVTKNPYFDVYANPIRHVVPPTQLPGLFGSEVKLDPAEGQLSNPLPPHHEHRCRDVETYNPDEDWDDLMHGNKD